MQKEYQLAVDIEKKILTPSFEVNTLDLKTIKLKITITKGMTLVDLTDITVRMSIRKPDGNVLFQDCQVVNAKGGQVEIILENQAYVMPGSYSAEIMCFKGAEKVAVTGSFSYRSIRGIMDDKAVESKSEFTAITGMIIDTQEVIEDLRKNGTGIDAQARSDIQKTATQSEQIAIELQSQFINIKYPPKPLIAAKGDGVTDDATAINNILKYASQNSAKVYFPDGIYIANSQITWDGKTTILGAGSGSVIKAGQSMPYLVVVDKDNLNLSPNGNFRTGRWLMLDVDGNRLANVSFYAKRGKGLEIGTLNITGGKRTNLLLGDETSGSSEKVWECDAHDIHLPGGQGDNRPDYSVRITSRFVDSTVRNITPTNAKLSMFYNQGECVMFDNIHPYIYPDNQMIDTMIYAGGEACKWNNLYLDTPGRVALLVDDTGQSFNNVYILGLGFLDSTTEKSLILIKKTGTIIDNVVVNMPTSVTTAEQLALVNVVTIDNSANNIYDVCLTNFVSVGGRPNKDVNIIGKVPYRFSHNYLCEATNRYTIRQLMFNEAVYKSETFKNITFLYEMPNAVYNIGVELGWNANWWITNKTTTGFRINFGTNPSTENSYMNLKVTPRG